MTDTVLCERTGHVARLTLNNPARHNSLGQEELQATGMVNDHFVGCFRHA